MISAEQVSTLLLRHWDVIGDGRPQPSGFSYVLVTKGSEPGSKLVFLAFPAGESAPRIAVKLPRSKSSNANVQMEYRNLKTVVPFGRHGRIVTPIPLVCGTENGWVWLAESVVDGIELGRDALSAPELAVNPVVDWLIHLGLSTPGLPSPSPDAEDLPELLKRADQYVTIEEERRVLDRAVEPLYLLDSQALPRVFEQRDMGPWNLLLASDGTIGVVDWESSRTGGFPAWDLFYFLAHCGFMIDRPTEPKERVKSFENTFWGRSGFANTAHTALRRYIRGMGLREDWLGPLSAACWLHHTLSEVTRLGIRPSQSVFWHMLSATLDRDCRLRCTA